jgi:hypothetical protein
MIVHDGVGRGQGVVRLLYSITKVGRGTTLPWPGGKPEGNLIEGGLARLIRSEFKKGCV